MTAKRTSLVVAFLAAVVLVGNWWIVRSAAPVSCPKPTEDCECVVRVFGAKGYGGSTNPSCSVSGRFFGWNMLTNCDSFTVGSERVVMCDPGMKAKLICGSPGNTTEISVASSSGVRLKCKTTKSGGKTVEGTDEPWVKNGKNQSGSTKFGSDERIHRAAEGEPGPRSDMAITSTEALTVIDGDAGLETVGDSTRRLVVASGEAVVEAFCSGSVGRFSAPAFVTVNNGPDYSDFLTTGSRDTTDCHVDVSGRWTGAYKRWVRGKLESFPAVLDIKGQTGTLQFGDTIMDIAELSAGGTSIHLRAVDQARTREVTLDGEITKGAIRFSAQDVADNQYRRGDGAFDRFYIAQWAVPAAAVGVPYNHPLLAVSPTQAAVSWRLAEGSLPEGISLDPETGTLVGTANASGSFPVVVEASDADGNTFRQPLTFKVKQFVVNTFYPDAIVGLPYKTTLTISGGSPPYQWSPLVPLPGVEVSTSGELSTASAPSTGLGFMGRVSDSTGVSQQVFLGINVRKIMIAGSQLLPEGTAGAPYSYKFEALGPAGVKWSIYPDLSDLGFTWNAETGDLSGTPLQPASMVIRVTATGGRESVSRDFVLAVNQPDGSAPAAASCAACGRR